MALTQPVHSKQSGCSDLFTFYIVWLRQSLVRRKPFLIMQSNVNWMKLWLWRSISKYNQTNQSSSPPHTLNTRVLNEPKINPTGGSSPEKRLQHCGTYYFLHIHSVSRQTTPWIILWLCPIMTLVHFAMTILYNVTLIQLRVNTKWYNGKLLLFLEYESCGIKLQ